MEKALKSAFPFLSYNTKEYVIEIPAYRGEYLERPGDYKIYLSLQKDPSFAKQKYGVS